MNQRDSFEAKTAERRRANRKAHESQVQVSFDTCSLNGAAGNLSKSGILFFTDGELRVTVEVTDGDEKTILHGNLVRCERIKGNHRGWAVEFDRE